MKQEQLLKEHIEYLRKKYYIDKYPNQVYKQCNECDIENFLFAGRNDLGYEQIKTTALGIEEPFHRASLIGFNTKNGPKWYIVDPTYGQFFYENNEDEIENLQNKIFKNYMFTNHKEFSTKLLEQGYIECTLQNMLYYINGFALSNAYTNNIDINLVYTKTEELLLSNNIVNKEIHNTYQKLTKLIYLRQQLITQENIKGDLNESLSRPRTIL